jgi:protein-glutamine gamma-glutamyltransferase
MNYSEWEQNLRREICAAALALHDSDTAFAVFANSRCNEQYWTRTSNGGWRLRGRPSDAIGDIFANGRLYATECATAMVIVYYKALLEVCGEDLFNRTFRDIYLMDWDIRDPLLVAVGRMTPATELIPGDRAYFANPDHSPDLPQWQGENVIVLGNDSYYGHGIGVTSADSIISSLNSRRKSQDSRPAYLMNSAGRPDFALLSRLTRQADSVTVWREFPPPVAPVRGEARNGYLHISGGKMFV